MNVEYWLDELWWTSQVSFWILILILIIIIMKREQRQESGLRMNDFSPSLFLWICQISCLLLALETVRWNLQFWKRALCDVTKCTGKISEHENFNVSFLCFRLRAADAHICGGEPGSWPGPPALGGLPLGLRGASQAPRPSQHGRENRLHLISHGGGF